MGARLDGGEGCALGDGGFGVGAALGGRRLADGGFLVGRIGWFADGGLLVGRIGWGARSGFERGRGCSGRWWRSAYLAIG